MRIINAYTPERFSSRYTCNNPVGNIDRRHQTAWGRMKELKVIGLNSGTSMDGIDAALFVIKPLTTSTDRHFIPKLSIEMLGADLFAFDKQFQKRLSRLVSSKEAALSEVCLLNAALGELFAMAANSLMRKLGLKIGDADLIGSHGQTIWHSPGVKSFWGVSCQGSLQLGEPAIISERTGLPVVADFRASDLAAGGQGAPVVAFADQVLFGSDKQATGVLNLGGIANITVIDKSGEAVLAFDTGPGNMVIDRVTHELFGNEYDDNGRLAAVGTINQEWLADLLKHPYFKMLPPKTTGREEFGHSFTDQQITAARENGISPHDCLATLTALTAATVADAYSRLIEPQIKLERIVLGGGGADNRSLVKLLEHYWSHPIQICHHEQFGISTKFKEALLFALLAYTTYFGIPNNVPRCTGAKHKVCLGKICKPLNG